MPQTIRQQYLNTIEQFKDFFSEIELLAENIAANVPGSAYRPAPNTPYEDASPDITPLPGIVVQIPVDLRSYKFYCEPRYKHNVMDADLLPYIMILGAGSGEINSETDPDFWNEELFLAFDTNGDLFKSDDRGTFTLRQPSSIEEAENFIRNKVDNPAVLQRIRDWYNER